VVSKEKGRRGLTISDLRVRLVRDAPVKNDGAYVLYWMTAARRVSFNMALERAVDWARKLGRPLLILEGLRVDYSMGE
jgi:deoxyribodipyrimidine photo-lyase